LLLFRPSTIRNNNKPLPGAEVLSADAVKGKNIYIANGCVGCHTQQIRNVDMDKMWGARPGIAADYAGIHRTDLWRNTATLMGTGRTGPDLTDVGNRQPSKDWNLVHLFNPRTVVKESVMPAYPWLFTHKKATCQKRCNSKCSKGVFKRRGRKSCSHQRCTLFDCLPAITKTSQTARRYTDPDFLYKREQKQAGTTATSKELDGTALYTANCQSCHQPGGEGLPGAFLH
jgi:cytochrome c oxidase cbb3-type subunit 2